LSCADTAVVERSLCQSNCSSLDVAVVLWYDAETHHGCVHVCIVWQYISY